MVNAAMTATRQSLTVNTISWLMREGWICMSLCIPFMCMTVAWLKPR